MRTRCLATVTLSVSFEQNVLMSWIIHWSRSVFTASSRLAIVTTQTCFHVQNAMVVINWIKMTQVLNAISEIIQWFRTKVTVGQNLLKLNFNDGTFNFVIHFWGLVGSRTFFIAVSSLLKYQASSKSWGTKWVMKTARNLRTKETPRMEMEGCRVVWCRVTFI